MSELSFQEREKVYDDLHGVATPQVESDQFIQTTIEKLDIALTKIPKVHRRKALDKAIFLKPNLLSNKKFKLMFLRSEEDYSPIKAAKRICKHYQIKLDLFGEINIAKDIRISDLTNDDLNASILSGSAVCLEQKDQTGRPIFVYDTTKFDHYKPIQNLRSTWYLCMTTLIENDIAQTKGITNLTYAPQKRSNNNNPTPFNVVADNMAKSGNMISSIPIRVTGYHYCTDDPKMNFALSLIRMTYGKQVRLRTRTHFGSELEMQYSLLTFGIHCSTILSCGDGKTELHDDYIKRRQKIELELDTKMKLSEIKTGIVEYPTPDDVLIGRGRPYHEYIGTRKLIQLIDSKLVEYYRYDSIKSSSTSAEDRFWKTCINTDIVTKTTESGGRFLQRIPNVGWKILNSTMSREKTANLFRYRYNLINKYKTTATTTNIQQQHQY